MHSETSDLLKRWAAIRCGVPIENIIDVYDTIYNSACETCDFTEIQITVRYKNLKNKKLNKEFFFSFLSDALKDIIDSGTIRLED